MLFPPEVDEDSHDNGIGKQQYIKHRDGDDDGHGEQKKTGAWPRIERINTNTGIRRFPPPQPQPIHSLQQQDSDLEDDCASDSDSAGSSAKSSRQATPFPFTREGSPAIVTLPNNLGSVHPKPLILDIIRTRVCTPGAVFLVEKIEDIPLYMPDLSPSDGTDSDSDEDQEEEEERPRPRRTINNLAEIIRREELERWKEERLERKRRKARHRIVRFLLGDGEVCIQALLRPEKFGILDGGLVYEGCYVRLGNFEIAEVEVDPAGGLVDGQKKKRRLDREDDLFGDPALAEEAARATWKARQQRQKEKKGQKMYYLVVGDMVTVGWNNVYLGVLRDQETVGKKDEAEVVTVRDGKVTRPSVFLPMPEKAENAADRAVDVTTHNAPPPETATDESIKNRFPPSTTASPKPKTVTSRPGTPRRDAMSHHYFAKTPGTGTGNHDMSPRRFLLSQATPQPSPSKLKPTTASAIPSAILNTDDIEEYISDNDLDDEAFEKLDISMDRVAERRQAPASTKPINAPGGPLQELQSAVIEQNKANSAVPSRVPPLALAITDPSRPLKLTPLRSIPNLPYKQNWMVNVLAVVVSLSPVEPAHLPPYTQRTARLADPSTSKRVLLTVFLDPEEFTPEVGSVVLLVGVKNHRFDGGCLKKYASDRPRDTGNGNEMCRWWLENPRVLEWCAGEVDQLVSWWREQMERQQQEEGMLDRMQTD